MFDQVTNLFVANKIIQEKDKDLYVYGLKQGVIMILQTSILLLIGILWGMWWQSILFIFSFTPLRLSAGGIHASRQWLCFVCTTVHFIIVLLTIQYVELTDLSIVGIIILSTMIIFFLAPIEDMNKPFDDIERVIFTKRTRIILAIELSIVLTLVFIDLKEAAECISITHVTMMIMVVLGSLKNTRYIKAHGK